MFYDKRNAFTEILERFAPGRPPEEAAERFVEAPTIAAIFGLMAQERVDEARAKAKKLAGLAKKWDPIRNAAGERAASCRMAVEDLVHRRLPAAHDAHVAAIAASNAADAGEANERLELESEIRELTDPRLRELEVHGRALEDLARFAHAWWPISHRDGAGHRWTEVVTNSAEITTVRKAFLALAEQAKRKQLEPLSAPEVTEWMGERLRATESVLRSVNLEVLMVLSLGEKGQLLRDRTLTDRTLTNRACTAWGGKPEVRDQDPRPEKAAA